VTASSKMIVTMVAALASTIPKRRMQRDPNVYTRNLPAVVDGEAFPYPMAVITVNQNQAAAFASGTHPSNPFASRNAFIDVQSLDSNLVLFLFVVVEDDDDPSSSFG